MPVHTFEEVLAFLYQQLPMYQRVGPAALKPSLQNTKDFCWELGLPQWQFHSIHVAGTNGKGSVSSMLASILQEAGYKTGLFTSPHLTSFTERIRINGIEISEEEVIEFVHLYRKAIDLIKPSFFELTTGMAFLQFASEDVDIAVVEVGLGGRLDSTNVITPELSVITQIDFDHVGLLGDTLPQIAGEKAGIIKQLTPVVISERHPETEVVFLEKAASLEAPILFAQDTHQLEALQQDLHSQRFRDLETGEEWELSLAGHYQKENLQAVLAAVDQLREDGWNIPAEAVRQGLQKVAANTGLRGRMEVLSESPTVLLDTGHNPAGVKAAVQQILAHPHDQLHIVWGMVNDKDVSAVLELLPAAATYYFVQADLPRAMKAEALAAKAHQLGLKGTAAGSVEIGMIQAKAAASPDDLIWVGGSTFVVAEAI
ncbi:MAG: folylpolyglutamate synthase/dihydrofolate synthase family protein [Bacteroidota bacterium]